MEAAIVAIDKQRYVEQCCPALVINCLDRVVI